MKPLHALGRLTLVGLLLAMSCKTGSRAQLSDAGPNSAAAGGARVVNRRDHELVLPHQDHRPRVQAFFVAVRYPNKRPAGTAQIPNRVLARAAGHGADLEMLARHRAAREGETFGCEREDEGWRV